MRLPPSSGTRGSRIVSVWWSARLSCLKGAAKAFSQIFRRMRPDPLQLSRIKTESVVHDKAQAPERKTQAGWSGTVDRWAARHAPRERPDPAGELNRPHRVTGGASNLLR